LTALVKREPREYRGKRLFEFSPDRLDDDYHFPAGPIRNLSLIRVIKAIGA